MFYCNQRSRRHSEIRIQQNAFIKLRTLATTNMLPSAKDFKIESTSFFRQGLLKA
jgi:hypothetical protein